jgi:hypothetical protein
MPKVKCAICKKELPVENAKYCSNDEMWLCKDHVKYSVFSNPKCPKCGKEVK